MPPKQLSLTRSNRQFNGNNICIFPFSYYHFLIQTFKVTIFYQKTEITKKKSIITQITKLINTKKIPSDVSVTRVSVMSRADETRSKRDVSWMFELLDKFSRLLFDDWKKGRWKEGGKGEGFLWCPFFRADFSSLRDPLSLSLFRRGSRFQFSLKKHSFFC